MTLDDLREIMKGQNVEYWGTEMRNEMKCFSPMNCVECPYKKACIMWEGQ